MKKNNLKLRAAYIILNIVFYLFFIGFSSYVIINAAGLDDLGRLGMMVIMMVLLLFVAIFMSFKISSWIRKGKL